MKEHLGGAIRLLDRIVGWCAWPGKTAAWLIVAIILLSVLSILAGMFRWHVFLSWTDPVFLFGTEFNSTSLVELQWHLFAVMMLFAGSYTYSLDGHVRVDILYSRMSLKSRVAINWIGDLFFLLPFALYIAWYSCDLVMFAYLTGEASSEMGLTHRWVVKAVLPIAMLLLAVQAGCRGVSGLLRFIGLCLGMSPASLDLEEKTA